jgi:hypothetical protein
MVTTIYILNNGITFLLLFLLSFIIFLRYNKKIDSENIIDYFMYLTNKLLLFVFSISAFFVFVVNINYSLDDKIITFINATFLNIIYFSFIMYSIFFLTKLIYFIREFVKSNDLFGRSYLDKLKLSKEEKRK